MDGYEQAVGDNPAVPEDAETRNRLLALFLFEKVFSEVECEVGERPEQTADGPWPPLSAS